MKRVKMMLLSLLVLGVVGGAMAFKAKFNATYCTTPVRILLTNGLHVCAAVGGGPLNCPNKIIFVETVAKTDFNVWCYTTRNLGDLDCSPAPPCVFQPVGLDNNN